MQVPREARIERVEFDEGWLDVIYADGKPRASLGPFRYKHDAAEFMVWLAESYAQLELREGSLRTQINDDIQNDREELTRINQRRRSERRDLIEVMQEVESNPGRYRRR